MISSYVGDDPVSSWDEEVLHLVASGLLRLAEQVGADGAVSVPYPASLQRALNRLAVMGVARGVDVPGSVAEVLQLAHRSLSEWPLRLPREVFDDGDVLLASGTPTRLCGEWALDVSDIEAEVAERVVLKVMGWCREMDDQEGYVAFRQLLIEHPVLDGDEFLDKRGLPALAALSDYIQQSYERPGAHLVRDKMFQQCGRCANLSVPTVHGWRCVEDDCARLQYRPGRRLPFGSEVWAVNRGVRTFVTGPGRAEARLFRWLSEKGYQPEAYPDFDLSDIRIPVPGTTDRWWAIDVKSWRNPALLARRLRRRPPRKPIWADRLFVVVDRERTRDRSEYVQLVNALAPGLAAEGITVRTEKTFLREDLPRLKGDDR